MRWSPTCSWRDKIDLLRIIEFYRQVVEVGEAELNLRHAMSIEGEMPAAWRI